MYAFGLSLYFTMVSVKDRATILYIDKYNIRLAGDDQGFNFECQMKWHQNHSAYLRSVALPEKWQYTWLTLDKLLCLWNVIDDNHNWTDWQWNWTLVKPCLIDPWYHDECLQEVVQDGRGIYMYIIPINQHILGWQEG